MEILLAEVMDLVDGFSKKEYKNKSFPFNVRAFLELRPSDEHIHSHGGWRICVHRHVHIIGLHIFFLLACRSLALPKSSLNRHENIGAPDR